MSTYSTAQDDLKSQLFSLDEKRKTLEEEASAITDELTTSIDGKEPMGISTPLVDIEGYPRADIDVYRARHLRKRLNEIRFDHNMLMKRVEEIMIQKMANEKEEEMELRKKRKPKPKFDPKTGKWVVSSWDGTVAGVENGHLRKFDDIGREDCGANVSSPSSEIGKESSNSVPETEEDFSHNIPFAKIENVLAGSPAAEARLKAGDEVYKFGTVDHSNHRNLRAMSDVVSQAYSDGAGVIVSVLRKKETVQDKMDDITQVVTLKLTPRPWDGRGLVGCVFSPIQ